jgi:hypothetical protein
MLPAMFMAAPITSHMADMLLNMYLRTTQSTTTPTTNIMVIILLLVPNILASTRATRSTERMMNG